MDMATANIPSRTRRWQTGTRLVAALGLAACGIAAIRANLAFALAESSPDLAIRLDPANAAAAAAEAESLLRGRDDPPTRARAEELARRALARDVTAASAARILATTAAIDGREDEARRLMGISESLSHRDVQTQLMLIEDAVQRNRVDEAVRHYDIALRTSPDLQGMLFPILIRAAAQPEVARALTSALATKPVWSDAFLDAVGRSAPDAGGAATLLAKAAQGGVHLPAQAVAILIGRLVDQKKFGPAWRLYVAAYPSRQQILRDRDFGQASQIVSPTWFDWILYPVEGRVPRVVVTPAGTRLRIEAPNGAAGNAARQLLMLVPGHYRIEGRIYDRAAGSGPVTIGLTCATTGKMLGSTPFPVANGAGSNLSLEATVPPECESQWLDINADGQDAIEGAKAEIGPLTVRKLE